MAEKETTGQLNEIRGMNEGRTPVPVSSRKEGPVRVGRSRKKKRFPWEKVLGITFGTLAVGAVAAYGYGVNYYSSRFLPGTVAEGVVIENLTAEEAAAKLAEAKAPEDSTFTLLTKDGGTEIFRTEPLSLRREYKGLEEAIGTQDNWSFLFTKDELKEQSFNYEVVCDEAGIGDVISSLSVCRPENTVFHEDAKVVREDDGTFRVSEAIDGNEIDKELLSGAILRAVYAKETGLSIEDTGAYITASVRENDETLLNEAAVENSFEHIRLEIDIGADCLVNITPDELRGMIAEGATFESAQVTDPEAVAKYVEKLSRVYGTKSPSGVRYFKSCTGTKPIIHTDYGWEMDKEETVKAITPMIEETARLCLGGAIGEEDQGCTAKAVWLQEAVSHGDRDTGTTWVEVDLANQTVYLIENNVQILETPCVSGKATAADRITPPGIFTIRFKSLDRYLVGYNPDGTESYRSHVNYWMPFNKNIGLHDATWRGRFGGDIYKWDGSHGCVNLPLSAAKEIYQHVYKGMPVIVYN